MELVDLLNQWFSNNSQDEFARAAGVTPSAVSRWKNGVAPPTFENCLRIAKAMRVDPLDIFAAAEKPEFTELYKHFLPDYAPAPAPAPLQASTCPDNNPDHISYHENLERILHDGGDAEILAALAVNALKAVLSESGGGPVKGQDFSVEAPFGRADRYKALNDVHVGKHKKKRFGK